MSKVFEDGLSDSKCADKLAEWECLLLILREMVTMEIHAKIVGLLQKERLLLPRKKNIFL
jgi:hypothetical protein